MVPPTKEQAHQFALLTMAGAPPADALAYIVEDINPDVARDMGARWATSKLVVEAKEALLGGPWARLTPQQRIKAALDKHYNEMAYFLWKFNYIDQNHPALKAKADTCRMSLEAKLAGMAGQMSAVSRFWDDLSSGKVKLGAVPAPGVAS